MRDLRHGIYFRYDKKGDILVDKKGNPVIDRYTMLDRDVALGNVEQEYVAEWTACEDYVLTEEYMNNFTSLKPIASVKVSPAQKIPFVRLFQFVQ